jgi:hypothetical protein
VRHLLTAGYLMPDEEPDVLVLRPSDLRLVPPAAVIRCLDDPAAGRARADAARRRLDTDFAWPSIAAETAGLYAAARPGPPRALGRPKIPTGNVFGTS